MEPCGRNRRKPVENETAPNTRGKEGVRRFESARGLRKDLQIGTLSVRLFIGRVRMSPFRGSERANDGTGGAAGRGDKGGTPRPVSRWSYETGRARMPPLRP